MAIIQFGPVVTGLRGKVGGVTFSASLAGPYLRSTRQPVILATTARSGQRRNLASAHVQWVALTQAQKAAWNAYGADPANVQYNSLGQPFALSGWQWFAKLTMRLFTVALGPITDPPTGSPPTIAAPEHLIFDWSAGSLTFEAYFPAGTITASQRPVSFVSIDPTGSRTAPPPIRQFANSLWVPALQQLFLNPAPYSPLQEPAPTTQAFLDLYNQDPNGLRSAPVSLTIPLGTSY